MSQFFPHYALYIFATVKQVRKLIFLPNIPSSIDCTTIFPNFQAVVPVLKYVRGESFSDKHWLEVFSLVGIPTSVSPGQADIWSSSESQGLPFGQFRQVKGQSILIRLHVASHNFVFY